MLKRARARIIWMLPPMLLLVAVGCVQTKLSAEKHVDGDGHTYEEEAPKPLFPVMTSDGIIFPHIHGLGYSSDGKRLMVPAHDGLRVHEQGEWREAGAPHDFMGFAPVEGGFFSSGHPTLFSNLPNPLGLVEVDEDGWKLRLMGLQGESDLHQIAAGYYSRTLYLVNSEPNRTLGTGLFLGENGGKRWKARPAKRVAGQIRQIAVHPTDVLTVALATSEGLFLSLDGGERFSPIAAGSEIHAASFSPDGQSLYYGGDFLWAWDLAKEVPTPIRFDKDEAEITFIAVNPADHSELTVATGTISIYRTSNDGRTWTPLVKDGLGQ